MDEMTDNRMTTAELHCDVCGKVTHHVNGECKDCLISDLAVLADMIVDATKTQMDIEVQAGVDHWNKRR